MAIGVDLPTGVAVTIAVVVFLVIFRAVALRAAGSMKGKGVLAALLVLGLVFFFFGAPVCGSSLVLLFVLAVAFVVLRRRKDKDREDREPEV